MSRKTILINTLKKFNLYIYIFFNYPCSIIKYRIPFSCQLNKNYDIIVNINIFSFAVKSCKTIYKKGLSPFLCVVLF